MKMFEKIESFLNLQKERMLLIDEKTGMLDRERNGVDLPGSRKMIYENAVKWLLDPKTRLEALASETQMLQYPGVISEDTTTSAIATFTTALLPAVRRIYSQLIAMDLVSLQPINGPNGIIFWVDHLFGTSGGGATEDQRMDQYRYRAYGASGEKGTIREVKYKLNRKDISCIEYKLKTMFTLEAEQDLRSQWNLDLEAELMPQVSQEIVREIDGLIIYALYNGAGAGNVYWDPAGYLTDDKTTADRKAYRETLFEAIVEADWLIYAKKFRHSDWIVCGTTAAARLEKLDQFKSSRGTTPAELQIGRYLIGTLDNRWRVYIDPWEIPATKMLLGIRGAGWQDAIGYYSPYIPLFTSDRYHVGEDFSQQQRGVMCRFAYGVLPEAYDQSPVLNNGLATVTLSAS